MAFLRGFRAFCVVVGRVELILGGALLSFMVLIITTQVVLRSVFDRPFSWMEEIVTYALVWLTFVGASFALKQLRHVTITTPISTLDEVPRGLVRLLADCIIIWVLATITYFAYQIIPIEGSAQSVALPIDLPRSLFFSAALFVSTIIMNISMLYYLIIDILTLAKRETPPDKHIYPLWEDSVDGDV